MPGRGVSQRTSWLIAVMVVAHALCVAAEPSLPPKPSHHFNDYANCVDAGGARRFEQRLSSFEKETSNQFLVVVFPQLPEATFLEDFTVKCAQAWGVGQKKLDNGIVLFVFKNDRKLRIEVGYGLEGALPDSVCKFIINGEIAPRFKRGDFAGGIDRGIEAIIKATRHEYQARNLGSRSNGGSWVFLVIIASVVVLVIWLQYRDFVLRRGGTFYLSDIFDFIFFVLRNSSSGRGGGSSGGGGFSGGGGRFGGGGASGDW